jgi:outer membrane immunogenic protein
MVFVLVTGGFGQDWKGFYVGGNLGGAFGRGEMQTRTIFSQPDAIATAGDQNLNPDGFTGGAQAGYNFQHGHLVLGVETDFGSMHLNQSKSITCCPAQTFTITQSVKTDWVFTARPRVGFISGGTMVYFTGGVAISGLNYQASVTDNIPPAAQEGGGVNKTQGGWTGGAGIERRISPRWSVKGEYLYADFGSVKATGTNITSPSPFPSNIFIHKADLQSHLVRLGFNYRF